MQQLNWIKSTAGNWLSFQRANLESVTADGVYIIWHAGNPSRVVYVGQGDVSARIKAHRNRPDINNYSRYGELYVTWASVPTRQKDGIERYLADMWSPLVGEVHPDAVPIAVNSPW